MMSFSLEGSSWDIVRSESAFSSIWMEYPSTIPIQQTGSGGNRETKTEGVEQAQGTLVCKEMTDSI